GQRSARRVLPLGCAPSEDPCVRASARPPRRATGLSLDPAAHGLPALPARRLATYTAPPPAHVRVLGTGGGCRGRFPSRPRAPPGRHRKAIPESSADPACRLLRL